MTDSALTDRIIAQGRAIVRAVEALGTIQPSGPFERAPVRPLMAAYKRRLRGIVEIAPVWVSEGILSVSERPGCGMVMIYVPAGEFEMGSTQGDSDEQPVHTVALDGFWIDRTEVTNAQFAAFLNDQGNQTEGGAAWREFERVCCPIEQAGNEYRPQSGYADHPVIEVRWYGAAAYCEWVGARLPTEAEWEYAARGQQGSVYPWGDEFDCSRGNFDDETQMDDYVVPGGEGCDGYAQNAPVGSFPGGASWCGALDMAGNVWEWVADWYDSDYYGSSPSQSPSGPSTGELRVLRGGSWPSGAWPARGADRKRHHPVDPGDHIGFRCARGSE